MGSSPSKPEHVELTSYKPIDGSELPARDVDQTTTEPTNQENKDTVREQNVDDKPNEINGQYDPNKSTNKSELPAKTDNPTTAKQEIKDIVNLQQVDDKPNENNGQEGQPSPRTGASSDWSKNGESSETEDQRGQKDDTNIDVDTYQETGGTDGDIKHEGDVSNDKNDTKETTESDNGIIQSQNISSVKTEAKDEKQQKETGSKPVKEQNGTDLSNETHHIETSFNNEIKQKEISSGDEIKPNKFEVGSNNATKPENQSVSVHNGNVTKSFDENGSGETETELTIANDNKTTSVTNGKITPEHDSEKKDGSTKQRNKVANSDAIHTAKDTVKQHETDPKKANSANKNKKPELNDNLEFYKGKIQSKPPPGYTIDKMLVWKGDYGMLERNHSYIQWLFPIPEGSGMNSSAQALQDHEAKAIRENSKLRSKVLEAYQMMLDFYGMTLVNDKTGEVKRNRDWEKRYEHLNKSIHNYFRITRIFKCLAELGWEQLQIPWLEFLMNEAALENGLPKLARGNYMEFWISAIKDEGKRAEYFERFYELKAGVSELKTIEDKKNESKKSEDKKSEDKKSEDKKSQGKKSDDKTSEGKNNKDKKNEGKKNEKEKRV